MSQGKWLTSGFATSTSCDQIQVLVLICFVRGSLNSWIPGPEQLPHLRDRKQFGVGG